ncbi:MAG: pknB, partial [Variovorax sp.]|nr:pknB [Variovorax sp.]
MSFDIELGYASRAGKKEVNEDFVAAMLPGPGQEAMGVIAAIADGVSRGGAGREAAQTTVVSLVRDYFGVPETWDTTVALDRIISAQNTWLAAVNRRRQPALGLTTLTALVLRGQSYTLAHVGDTRAYLLRDGELRQLSIDHVVAHRDFMHQLTRCVGADERLVVDYSQGELQCGDVFVLLSDGVHGMLGEAQLRRMLSDGLSRGSPAQALSEALVQGAAAKGGRDDATALVLRLQGASEATLRDEQRQSRTLPAPARL